MLSQSPSSRKNRNGASVWARGISVRTNGAATKLTAATSPATMPASVQPTMNSIAAAAAPNSAFGIRAAWSTPADGRGIRRCSASLRSSS